MILSLTFYIYSKCEQWQTLGCISRYSSKIFCSCHKIILVCNNTSIKFQWATTHNTICTINYFLILDNGTKNLVHVMAHRILNDEFKLKYIGYHSPKRGIGNNSMVSKQLCSILNNNLGMNGSLVKVAKSIIKWILASSIDIQIFIWSCCRYHKIPVPQFQIYHLQLTFNRIISNFVTINMRNRINTYFPNMHFYL